MYVPYVIQFSERKEGEWGMKKYLKKYVLMISQIESKVKFTDSKSSVKPKQYKENHASQRLS